MKEKRNCQGGYPIYQQPMMVPPYGLPVGYPSQVNNIDQQLNNIERQLNVLEQRVSRLESTTNTTTNYNKYNDSNYYMV